MLPEHTIRNITNNYIQNIYSNDKQFNLKEIDELFIEFFQKKYISDKDKLLIDIIFKQNVTQDDFDEFISKWDIEEEGGYKALLLSYFMKKHPEIKYPKYIEPRLKGLLKYCRFRNLRLISHFAKIINKLKEEYIKILVFKGASIQYYFKEFPRLMGDIDIMIPKGKLDLAKNIVANLGYYYREVAHSIDVHEYDTDLGVVDIHHTMAPLTGFEDKILPAIYQRAFYGKIYGIENILIPCIEDIFFIAIINLTKNLLEDSSFESILYSIFDCKYLLELKENFDWNIVKENTVKIKAEAVVHIAIRFINKYIPNKMPEMFQKEYHTMILNDIYTNWFITALKKKRPNVIFNRWLVFKLKSKNPICRFVETIIKSVGNIITVINFRINYKFILYAKDFIVRRTTIASLILKYQKLVEYE